VSVGFPCRLRRRSQTTSPVSAAAPSSSSAPTDSPPSCQTRIPSTTPPMPSTDSSAPTGSTSRAPVYGTSRTRPIPESTTAMTTASRANATRHERYVVMNPPSSGPTAAAIAAAAPTSAYTFFCAAPSKFPWIRDCMAGSSSEAPSPPTIAQNTMIAARSWARVIATAPTA